MERKFEIVELPPYRAIGLKWEGTYEDVPTLKDIIHTMRMRVEELSHAVKPDVQLGLSYHVVPGGFAHYSVFEVEPGQSVPEGMIEISIPQMTYLFTRHEGGNIGQTYNQISQWLDGSDYHPFRDAGVTYYDGLPIKHERYSGLSDSTDPHFDILIPIVKAADK